ncbi:hypothetical protein OD91_1317 [Lutibacter sp. Hel_I_33_5]|uniref:hypothetical protein n=1 Tax=Lutibacter sp. Hel_I_33_5 TaxID=1566289 RepID=UPI0011A8C922|nr:hypothetical protein [Lutibacter sp. Hel_I_33_5]TVZ56038.1 hypothetical protein OD91_1317 [Lutibacter sp. Hel_I_33_5]
MSFIADMAASLRNNKRNRVSNFERLKNYKKANYKTLHFDNKATPHQLKKIREKIKEQNRISFRNKAIVLSIIFLILIYVIGFVKF